MQVIWIVSYGIAAALPPAPFWTHQQAFETILGATPRLALAGMGAYLVGEFLNAYVLARLKLALAGRFVAFRLIASTVVGQAVDSALFLTLASPAPCLPPRAGAARGLGLAAQGRLGDPGAAAQPAADRLAQTGGGPRRRRPGTDFNPFRLRA